MATSESTPHTRPPVDWIEPIPDTFENIVHAIVTTPPSNPATPPAKPVAGSRESAGQKP